MADKDAKKKPPKENQDRDREIEASFRQETRRRTKPTAGRDRERELLAIFERILRLPEDEFRRALIEDVGLIPGSPEFERAIRYREDLEP